MRGHHGAARLPRAEPVCTRALRQRRRDAPAKSKTYCGKRNGYEFKFSANDPKVLQQLPPEVRI